MARRIARRRIPLRAFQFLLVGAVFLLTWQTAAAQQGAFVHVVQPGETLASIAQKYYGDASRETILVNENGLVAEGGSSIVPGLRLRIPYSFYYRVAPGDTWSKLAERFYGLGKRSDVLIAANDGSADTKPEEKAQILVPYAVRHVAAQREDLGKIAENYYGSRGRLVQLRRFNRLPRNRLNRGQIVLVPLSDLMLSEEGRKYIENRTGQPLSGANIRSLQQQMAERLPKLRQLVRKGNYIAAVAFGSELAGSNVLTVNQLVNVQKELATAYVALDEEELAIQAFKKALQYRPELELDTAKTSPKVLLALRKAKGK